MKHTIKILYRPCRWRFCLLDWCLHWLGSLNFLQLSALSLEVLIAGLVFVLAWFSEFFVALVFIIGGFDCWIGVCT